MFKLFRRNKREDINEDCFAQICEALIRVMPKESPKRRLTGETKIETLGIDSIRYINLFISLEDLIGKDLEEIVDSIDLSSIQTVDDIYKLVVSLR